MKFSNLSISSNQNQALLSFNHFESSDYNHYALIMTIMIFLIDYHGSVHIDYVSFVMKKKYFKNAVSSLLW